MKIPSCDIFEIASANKLFNWGDNSMQSQNAVYLKTTVLTFVRNDMLWWYNEKNISVE